MRISRNFWLYEFERSQKASRHNVDNSAPPEAVSEIQGLVLNVLQPVRDFLGRPIYISSGYRSPWLNREIGGATQSQHMYGQAADFECWGVSNVELFHTIKNLFTYDQLILERHDPQKGENSGWIHVSYRSAGDNRRESFKYP